MNIRNPYIFLCSDNSCAEYAEKPIENIHAAFVHVKETGHEVFQCLPDPHFKSGNSGLELVAIIDKDVIETFGNH